jgi:serine/threonine protein kinase
MVGQSVLHYKITEKLGEGGMGVVYKAHDTKLDRFVALKFLPSNASVNADTKARFTQEAKAAAALNHPNICTIHGVEESDGNLFIVMEYIDGGTLRDKVPYQKIDDAVSVAIQIGEALYEAHAKGNRPPRCESR